MMSIELHFPVDLETLSEVGEVHALTTTTEISTQEPVEDHGNDTQEVANLLFASFAILAVAGVALHHGRRHK